MEELDKISEDIEYIDNGDKLDNINNIISEDIKYIDDDEKLNKNNDNNENNDNTILDLDPDRKYIGRIDCVELLKIFSELFVFIHQYCINHGIDGDMESIISETFKSIYYNQSDIYNDMDARDGSASCNFPRDAFENFYNETYNLLKTNILQFDECYLTFKYELNAYHETKKYCIYF